MSNDIIRNVSATRCLNNDSQFLERPTWAALRENDISLPSQSTTRNRQTTTQSSIQVQPKTTKLFQTVIFEIVASIF